MDQLCVKKGGSIHPLPSLLYLPPPLFSTFMPLFLPFSFLFFPQMRYFAFLSQFFSMFSSHRWDLQYKLVENDDQPSMLFIISTFGSCWLSSIVWGLYPPLLESYLLLIVAFDNERLVEHSIGSVVEGC